MPAKLFLDVESMAQMYRNGMSCEAIGREIGCSLSVVFKRLKAAGVTRTLSDSRRSDRFDEHFFDDINSEEKAYWLGFLLADGCVRTGKNTLQINLKSGDKSHLERFRKAISSTTKISFAKHRLSKEGVVSFVVTSTHMTNRLRELGIVANAKRCVPPGAAELERHFWRGCIDGDGHLTISRGVRQCGLTFTQPMMGLCGTQETIESFARFASRVCGTTATARKDPSKNMWLINLHGPRAKTLADYVWSDATVYLERKHRIWQTFVPSRDVRGDFRREILSRIVALQATGLTHRQVGAQIGMSEAAVGLRLRSAGIKTPRSKAR